MSIYLETDVQPEAPCSGCNGSGEQCADRGGGCPEPDWCVECGGVGACGIGSQMATLAHNLAIAGALTRAHALGFPRMFTVTRGGETYDDWEMRWEPNAKGRAAP
jgi:hypothetical protein